VSYPHKHTPAVAPGIRTASQASANNIGVAGVARPAVKPQFNPASGAPVMQAVVQQQLPPDHVAQLKLEVAGRKRKRSSLNVVWAYVRANKDEDGFYDRLEIEKPEDNKPYLYAASVYRRLRSVHPSVLKMLSQFKKWAAETHIYQFDSWEEAGAEAYQVAHKAQKALKLHPPSPPGTPLNDEQNEYVTHLNGPGRTAEHMKTNDKWKELKVQGQIGEYAHQQLLASTGIPYRDANELLGYNMAGLDTISNTPTPFGQSKMHLGTTESAEEMVSTYTGHIEKAPGYAQIFLTKLFAATNPGQVMRDKLIELNKTWKNDDISKLNNYGRKNEWRVKGKDDSPLEPSFVDDKVQHTAPVKLILRGMIFPVPCDVYDLIPTDLLGWFERLPYDLNWYRKVKSQMEYKFYNPPKTAEDKDPTWGS